MVDFLLKLWRLTRPYQTRLILGLSFGILAGFTEAALVGTVYFVFAILFPQGGIEEVARALGSVERFHPGLAAWLKLQLETISITPVTGSVVAVASMIPVVMLARGAITYLNTYFLQWVAIRAVGDLRSQLYGHLLHLPLSFFSKTNTGELISRLGNDIAVLHNALASSLMFLIRDPITLLVFAVTLMSQQPKMTLMSLLIFPVCVVPIAIYARKLRKSSEALQGDAASIFRTLHEGLHGVRIAKAYNLEPVLVDEHDRRTRGYNSRFMRVTRSGEIPGPLIEFFGAVGVAILLAVTALHNRGASLAGFLAFVSAVFLMYARIKSLIRLYNRFIQARAASRRVFELLDVKTDLPDPERPRGLGAQPGAIHFDQVGFDYGEQAVLQDIDLKIEPGQLVALVGASGSGKTTLTNLLLRFYDVRRGAVRLGGVDLREYTARDLRSRMAVVTQETILFDDTIRRNIELGRLGATDAEIEAAARQARAHEFILGKPQGYQTLIGERGVTLSGGERQRLAIARAILRDAPILILDEATSALDTESERMVQAALEKLMQGRTTICIAHRLSTVQRADLIVVLEQGRIAERGTHAELLARNGIYRKLYDLQFQS